MMRNIVQTREKLEERVMAIALAGRGDTLDRFRIASRCESPRPRLPTPGFPPVFKAALLTSLRKLLRVPQQTSQQRGGRERRGPLRRPGAQWLEHLEALRRGRGWPGGSRECLVRDFGQNPRAPCLQLGLGAPRGAGGHPSAAGARLCHNGLLQFNASRAFPAHRGPRLFGRGAPEQKRT